MKSLKTLLYACLLLVLLPRVHGQAHESSSLQENLHNYLQAIHLKKGFSGELLVARGKEILFHEAVGLASREHQLRLKPRASYRIASLTKTFTASLIALAREEKKLDFNDKVIYYCTGLSDKFREVSIHQLLTHSSGLPHIDAIQEYWQVKSKLHMDGKQLINEINQLDLLFVPGTQMHYSSLGYSLLAQILEEVYGKEYEQLLEEKIGSKLQLDETGLANTLKIIPRMVSGYHLLSDNSVVVAPYRNYSLLKGAGDMYASAPDLLKWGSSFFTSSLMNEKAIARLFRAPELSHSSATKPYGYGWFIGQEKPAKYFHGGGTWGFSSYLALYPEDSISLIIVSNVSFLPLESIAGELEKIVWGNPFSIPKPKVALPAESINLATYSGSYVSASGKVKLQITNRDGRLFARLGENPAFEIYPKGRHRFFGKKIDVLLSFEMEKEVPSGLKAEKAGQLFYFTKE